MHVELGIVAYAHVMKQKRDKKKYCTSIDNTICVCYAPLTSNMPAQWACHDLQCSGACWTYFPWPRTRCVDPRSILAEQHTMPDEATKVGMRNTDTHICVPSLLVHNVYIYIRPVLGISPVWKLTKMSHKPSVCFHPHSKPSVLDALYLSISDLSSVLTPSPLQIICRPQ